MAMTLIGLVGLVGVRSNLARTNSGVEVPATEYVIGQGAVPNALLEDVHFPWPRVHGSYDSIYLQAATDAGFFRATEPGRAGSLEETYPDDAPVYVVFYTGSFEARNPLNTQVIHFDRAMLVLDREGSAFSARYWTHGVHPDLDSVPFSVALDA